MTEWENGHSVPEFFKLGILNRLIFPAAGICLVHFLRDWPFVSGLGFTYIEGPEGLKRE
jgi:hypothetical protein